MSNACVRVREEFIFQHFSQKACIYQKNKLLLQAVTRYTCCYDSDKTHRKDAS